MRHLGPRRTKKHCLPTVVAGVPLARYLNRSTLAAFANSRPTRRRFFIQTLPLALRRLCLIVLRAFELSVIRVSKENHHGYSTDRIRGGGEFEWRR